MCDPLGPVFWYDLVRNCRSGRPILHRTLYEGVVLVAAAIAYWAYGMHGEVSASNSLAFGQAVVGALAVFQLLGTLIGTPLLVAPVIVEERERGTLDLLLTTDLTNSEILFGKLAARLLQLVLFILTALPILLVLNLDGIYPPSWIFMYVLVLAAQMFGLGGLSLYFSITSRRVARAVINTLSGYTAYLFAVGYFSLYLGFAATDIVFWLLGLWAPAFLGVVTTAWTIIRLRKIKVADKGNRFLSLLNQIANAAFGVVIVLYALNLFGVRLSSPFVPVGIIAWLLAAYLPSAWKSFFGTAVDPDTKPKKKPKPQRPRFALGDNPLVWKEVCPEFWLKDRRDFYRSLWLFYGPVTLLVAVGAWFIPAPVFGMIAACVISLLIFLWCFLIVIDAASRIASERELHTMDALLCTPISRWQIVGTKLLGCLANAPPALCVPMLGLVACCVIRGSFGVVFVLLALVYPLFAAGLGLFVSSLSSTTLKAIILSTVILLVMFLGPPLIFAFGIPYEPPVWWQRTLLCAASPFGPMMSLLLFTMPDVPAASALLLQHFYLALGGFAAWSAGTFALFFAAHKAITWELRT